MNIQELLEDADLLVSNSFSTQRKVGWMNQVQRQLYKEMPISFSGSPPDIREDQLTYVPRFPQDYHELLSFGVAKRMAERVQDFKIAGELEVRYQALLKDAIKFTTPKIKSVTRTRQWI